MKAPTSLAAVLLLASLGAAAQDATGLRDPTEWPAALRAAVAASAASGAAAGPPRVDHLVFVDGRGYAVVGGRRLGVGAMLGEAQIVRIEPRAVWLKEGGVTRREPLYAGVEIRPEPAASAASKAASGKAKKPGARTATPEKTS